MKAHTTSLSGFLIDTFSNNGFSNWDKYVFIFIYKSMQQKIVFKGDDFVHQSPLNCHTDN